MKDIENLSPEKRYQFLLQSISKTKKIWILKDEHGCVMLNSEEEDCVPIWPSEDLALAWATGEWSACKAESIELKYWQQMWTPGLEDDELSIAIFPNENNEGLVISPYEFDADMRK